MGLTTRYVIDVPTESEYKALNMLNKAINDDFEDVIISGIDVEPLECHVVSLEEIVKEEDGIVRDLYKGKVLKVHLVPTKRKEIKVDDILIIDSESHIVINYGNSVNLYAPKKQMFYFENNLQSIQEICAYFEEKNVKYEIHIVR